MPTDLTDVMVRLLGRNQSPDPCRLGEKTPSLDGITASLQQDLLRIEMRFLSRSAYCCMEPACHLPTREGKRWRSLRRAMAAEGLEPPNRMRTELRMVVEEGLCVSIGPNRFPVALDGTAFDRSDRCCRVVF